uniref:A kinase (PRKA) anchor protein 17A n=1 Tax=Eptatretus burgeri TaxID=7764 RepID=A0A8C4QS77_EPTBU
MLEAEEQDAEIEPLCSQLGLFLRPVGKVIIKVSLPAVTEPGQTISNWEVMERLKAMALPSALPVLRVTRTSLTSIRFEAEAGSRSEAAPIAARLDSRVLKLSGLPEALRVRAAAAGPKVDAPSRHDWETFFRESPFTNENEPGERPDTLKIEGLPCRWFATKGESELPNEELILQAFSAYGKIRALDAPCLDPRREEIERRLSGRAFSTFGVGGRLCFVVFVQYEVYAGFERAMTALRGRKLLLRAAAGGPMLQASIKVWFDTTRHLSANSVRQREAERHKLQQEDREKEDAERVKIEEEERKEREDEEKKEQERLQLEEKEHERAERRYAREARRRAREAARREAKRQQRLAQRVLEEERRLLLAQRKLEAIRLLTELLSRAKVDWQHEEQEAARQNELAEVEAERARETRRAERKERRLAKREEALRDLLQQRHKQRHWRREEEEREAKRQQALIRKHRLRSAIAAGALCRKSCCKDSGSSSSSYSPSKHRMSQLPHHSSYTHTHSCSLTTLDPNHSAELSSHCHGNHRQLLCKHHRQFEVNGRSQHHDKPLFHHHWHSGGKATSPP